MHVPNPIFIVHTQLCRIHKCLPLFPHLVATPFAKSTTPTHNIFYRYPVKRYEIPSWKILGATPGRGHLEGSCFDDCVYSSRSEEILKWLEDHPKLKGFVILDDRPTAGLGALAPHFVHCRSDVGLTQEDVLRALEILQQPRADIELAEMGTFRKSIHK